MIQTIISMLPVTYVAVTAIPLVVIDIKHHRLPNKIVLPMIALTLLTQLTLAIWTGAWASLGISVGLGFAVMVLGVIANYYDYIGMGDAKFIAGITMILSWFSILGAILLLPIALVVGVITALVMLMLQNARVIPLAPSILITFATIAALTIR
jgi:leader peptidase (prepilin peptidase)/N-methyltransferase